MKLKTVLATICEPKYIISGLTGYPHEGTFVMVDMISHSVEKCINAFNAQFALEIDNPKVKWISYNTAYKCLQIDIM